MTFTITLSRSVMWAVMMFKGADALNYTVLPYLPEAYIFALQLTEQPNFVVGGKRTRIRQYCRPEMETGRIDRHRSSRPAVRVSGRVEVLRPDGQAG